MRIDVILVLLGVVVSTIAVAEPEPGKGWRRRYFRRHSKKRGKGYPRRRVYVLRSYPHRYGAYGYGAGLYGNSGELYGGFPGYRPIHSGFHGHYGYGGYGGLGGYKGLHGGSLKGYGGLKAGFGGLKGGFSGSLELKGFGSGYGTGFGDSDELKGFGGYKSGFGGLKGGTSGSLEFKGFGSGYGKGFGGSDELKGFGGFKSGFGPGLRKGFGDSDEFKGFGGYKSGFGGLKGGTSGSLEFKGFGSGYGKGFGGSDEFKGFGGFKSGFVPGYGKGFGGSDEFKGFGGYKSGFGSLKGGISGSLELKGFGSSVGKGFSDSDEFKGFGSKSREFGQLKGGFRGVSSGSQENKGFVSSYSNLRTQKASGSDENKGFGKISGESDERRQFITSTSFFRKGTSGDLDDSDENKGSARGYADRGRVVFKGTSGSQESKGFATSSTSIRFSAGRSSEVDSSRESHKSRERDTKNSRESRGSSENRRDRSRSGDSYERKGREFSGRGERKNSNESGRRRGQSSSTETRGSREENGQNSGSNEHWKSKDHRRQSEERRTTGRRNKESDENKRFSERDRASYENSSAVDRSSRERNEDTSHSKERNQLSSRGRNSDETDGNNLRSRDTYSSDESSGSKSTESKGGLFGGSVISIIKNFFMPKSQRREQRKHRTSDSKPRSSVSTERGAYKGQSRESEESKGLLKGFLDKDISEEFKILFGKGDRKRKYIPLKADGSNENIFSETFGESDERDRFVGYDSLRDESEERIRQSGGSHGKYPSRKKPFVRYITKGASDWNYNDDRGRGSDERDDLKISIESFLKLVEAQKNERKFEESEERKQFRRVFYREDSLKKFKGGSDESDERKKSKRFFINNFELKKLLSERDSSEETGRSEGRNSGGGYTNRGIAGLVNSDERDRIRGWRSRKGFTGTIRGFGDSGELQQPLGGFSIHTDPLGGRRSLEYSEERTLSRTPFQGSFGESNEGIRFNIKSPETRRLESRSKYDFSDERTKLGKFHEESEERGMFRGMLVRGGEQKEFVGKVAMNDGKIKLGLGSLHLNEKEDSRQYEGSAELKQFRNNFGRGNERGGFSGRFFENDKSKNPVAYILGSIEDERVLGDFVLNSEYSVITKKFTNTDEREKFIDDILRSGELEGYDDVNTFNGGASDSRVGRGRERFTIQYRSSEEAKNTFTINSHSLSNARHSNKGLLRRSDDGSFEFREISKGIGRRSDDSAEVKRLNSDRLAGFDHSSEKGVLLFAKKGLGPVREYYKSD